MGVGVQRIVDVLAAAKDKKRVVAVVVPRPFAKRLGEELYPMRLMRTWNIPAMDRVNELEATRVKKDREAWDKYVKQGGHIGSVFGVPFFVLDDVVVCALAEDELKEYAEAHGFDIDEAVKAVRAAERMDGDGNQWGEGVYGDEGQGSREPG